MVNVDKKKYSDDSKGCVFFDVSGHNISEGIDFSDGLSRCVNSEI